MTHSNRKIAPCSISKYICMSAPLHAFIAWTRATLTFKVALQYLSPHLHSNKYFIKIMYAFLVSRQRILCRFLPYLSTLWQWSVANNMTVLCLSYKLIERDLPKRTIRYNFGYIRTTVTESLHEKSTHFSARNLKVICEVFFRKKM